MGPAAGDSSNEEASYALFETLLTTHNPFFIISFIFAVQLLYKDVLPARLSANICRQQREMDLKTDAVSDLEASGTWLAKSQFLLYAIDTPVIFVVVNDNLVHIPAFNIP